MNKKEMLGIAEERIEILHKLSMKERTSRSEWAMMHLGLMERIAKRADITISQAIKRSYCKKCKNPYGTESRLRLKKGKILLLTCGECGDRRRFDYSKK